VIELETAQRQQLDSIRKKYKTRLVLAFGSRIRGIVHQASDLDIGVLYEEEQKPLDVAVDLQKVFPHYEVDLVNLNHADPLLLNEVNKECQLLAGDEKDYHIFRIHAFHRYHDFKPYLQMEAQLNSRRLARLKDGS
jgi:predicted nucleotidyltransferase